MSNGNRWQVVEGKVRPRPSAYPLLRLAQVVAVALTFLVLSFMLSIQWLWMAFLGLVAACVLDALMYYIVTNVSLPPQSAVFMSFVRTFGTILALIAGLALLIPIAGVAAVSLIVGWAVGRLASLTIMTFSQYSQPRA